MASSADEGYVVFVSRSLSYSVIFLSVFMKIPQVLALYRAGSSRGVSTRGYWLEIACYEIAVAYGYFYNFHVTTYGESILLAIQSYVILALAIQYGREWTVENGAWLVANGAFVAAIVTKSLPASVISFLLVATIPLIIASRGAQILSLYRLKSVGDVSLTMFALASYGCTARLFTIWIEIKDLQVFLTYVLSLALNLTVMLQCIHYGQHSNVSGKMKKSS